AVIETAQASISPNVLLFILSLHMIFISTFSRQSVHPRPRGRARVSDRLHSVPPFGLVSRRRKAATILRGVSVTGRCRQAWPGAQAGRVIIITSPCRRASSTHPE